MGALNPFALKKRVRNNGIAVERAISCNEEGTEIEMGGTRGRCMATERQQRKRSLLTLSLYTILAIGVIHKLRYFLEINREQDGSYVPLRFSETQYFFTEKRPMNSRSVLPTMTFPNPITIDGKQPKIRFLWGIVCTAREKDFLRRQTIRETYLSYYKDRPELGTPNLICSIHEYTSDAKIREECELIYTFVAGGATEPDAPTQLLDDVDPNRPMTLDPPTATTTNGNGKNQDASDEIIENDITYLNVKENKLLGKSHTYLKWASAKVQDGTINVDYISKADTDTILFPPRWFAFTHTSLMPHPYNRFVYGGIFLDRLGCGGVGVSHCRHMVNKNYVAGEMSFLSPDLSHFITSDQLDRKGMKSNDTEDVITANYVHSSPQPVHEVVITPKHVLWEHGDQLKDPVKYLKRWNQLKDTWRLDEPAFAMR
mmetsp:Transcript_24972/g.69401  ORF Transcript_24972/g.69401 Transcript_24972/m.69401 type:complete len:428 (-) Transcript_24972:490-1773(-)|eukprot:CAMPEP_0198125284 /NCGR_PEP_ID=MMETSP1442-20131203/42246_1 /TAXON_ID= /ORGANISM="Craspedostauros australis, Strain CCMP3328" /LENGTH=427 /DNA_ID=CAMNT_0043784859 /DNA_START=177 /DNA_END=1460 /DNA_ORIENTATION=-